MSRLEDLFERHVGASFDKQLFIADLLERKGPVSIVTEPLGEERAGRFHWTPGKARDELRAFGEREGVPELCGASSDADPRTLALVAVGVVDADGYHRDEDGTYVLVRRSGFVRRPARPSLRVSSVFPDLLLSASVRDPGAALGHYLAYYGFAIAERTKERLVARAPSGDELHARFDAKGRLVELAARPTSVVAPIELAPPPGLDDEGDEDDEDDEDDA